MRKISVLVFCFIFLTSAFCSAKKNWGCLTPLKKTVKALKKIIDKSGNSNTEEEQRRWYKTFEGYRPMFPRRF